MLYSIKYRMSDGHSISTRKQLEGTWMVHALCICVNYENINIVYYRILYDLLVLQISIYLLFTLQLSSSRLIVVDLLKVEFYTFLWTVIKQNSGYVIPFSDEKKKKNKWSLGKERECRAPFPKPISYVGHF